MMTVQCRCSLNCVSSAGRYILIECVDRAKCLDTSPWLQIILREPSYTKVQDYRIWKTWIIELNIQDFRNFEQPGLSNENPSYSPNFLKPGFWTRKSLFFEQPGLSNWKSKIFEILNNLDYQMKIQVIRQFLKNPVFQIDNPGFSLWKSKIFQSIIQVVRRKSRLFIR